MNGQGFKTLPFFSAVSFYVGHFTAGRLHFYRVTTMNQERKIQIIGILLLCFSAMFLISLFGHYVEDDMLLTSDEAAYGNPVSIKYLNPGGMVGAYLSYLTLLFFGWTSYFAGIFLAVLSLRIIGWDLAKRFQKHAGMLWVASFLFFTLLDIPGVPRKDYLAELPDGVGELGQILLGFIVHLIGKAGAYLITITALICTFLYYASISHRFRNLLQAGRQVLSSWSGKLQTNLTDIMQWFKDRFGKRDSFPDEEQDDKTFARILKKKRKAKIKSDANLENRPPEKDRVIAPENRNSFDPSAISDGKKVILPRGGEDVNELEGAESSSNQFQKPSLDLLNLPVDREPAFEKSELEETARRLRETLETFGVGVSGSIEMFPGPIITRFEVKPAAGVKVNQIANLADDLALNLRARSIRIIAPIPGKAAVGIEIPNHKPQMIYLREILESEEFKNNKFQLPLAMGKDITGKPTIADLATMPHLLIAGTTGSGKSVCMNVMITSLIYTLHPDQLRFVFIDPKMLELTIYQGIPHLEDRVVTRPKQAERVLGNIVVEMESRYRMLAGATVKSIVDYNNKQKSDKTKLPYIVVIIDELADLMMSAQSGKIELLITRLAQMARAVGIHLILATQRPSVDVITGLIKANFPSRIAFQVPSKTDSRTILDGNGAEKLLKNGDMLFLEVGAPEPIRLHGPFISAGESEKLVTFLKGQEYSQNKVEEVEAEAEEKSQMQQFSDPVLMEAIEIVVRQGQASVSLLQRKLGVGYQRAARIIDDLEEMKIIGSYNESKAREVLVDQAFLDNIKKSKFIKA